MWCPILCLQLMIFVDYMGPILPVIGHAPWNGVHLADFVMPFFLFVAGVSLALVYKKVPNQMDASWKAMVRALKLFLLGVFLQGGYLHGTSSLTYGVDIERIRWLGILQRISIGYIIAALCEIWLSHSSNGTGIGFFKIYYWQFVAISLSAIHLGLSYCLYVPDWQFSVSSTTSSLPSLKNCTSYSVRECFSEVFISYEILNDLVSCGTRGDLGPACNSAGMIDRYVLGINHLYMKPGYRNLKECNIASSGRSPETLPSWCLAPFDPEGILSSLTASVTCIIGLQYGHVLAQLQEHKERLYHWTLYSVSFLISGSILPFIGIPLNKSLYTVSYMLFTSASSGIIFCGFYLLVDVYGCRQWTVPLEWLGKHALLIFIILTSNIAIILIQGFYWAKPENNI
ncbi:hypothetical protein RJ641_013985, partial [Dillenia turbinata]